jgi:hypothetical protein
MSPRRLPASCALAALLLLTPGCAHRPPAEAQTGSVALSSGPGGQAGRADVVVFQGACDASGAVALGSDRFAVGDDEDNVLRLYDGKRGGAPLARVDLSAGLHLPARKRPPEADIEAATGLGDRAFWLTSHGRNSKGKREESRMRFFATSAPQGGEAPQLVGRVSERLLEDLLAEPRLAPFGLAAAAELAPKEPGGLNIEGMTAMADGRSLLLGFRNPVPQGKALLVPLLNPGEVVEGAPARFGEPRLLALGGLGVRSISWWRGRYLLVAGGTAGEGTSQLYTWRGGEDAPARVAEVDLTGLNPEAFVTPEDSDAILLLSDDGSAPVGGVECKRLKDPAQKRFRGLWVRLPQEA